MKIRLKSNQDDLILMRGDAANQRIGLYDTVSAHTADTAIHVTAADKAKWEQLKNVTYAELGTLISNSGLTPGAQYRITDYVTTTTQENTTSAGHQFDIIVTADSVNSLNENAKAIQHSGDTYFSGASLDAWELKYCIDNDSDRFVWADTGSTGRGVIYYMKDEFGNECPYDFKNIQFKRVCSTDIEKRSFENLDGVVNDYETRVKVIYVSDNSYKFYSTAVTPTNITKDGKPYADDWVFNVLESYEDFYKAASLSMWAGGTKYMRIGPCFETKYGNNQACYACPVLEKKSSGGDVWLYTFTVSQDDYENPTGTTEDSSLDGLSNNVYNNVMGSCGTQVNNNVFYGSNCYGNKLGVDCSENIFGGYNYYNVFENKFHSNSFGNGCDSNSFGNYCQRNSFGNTCQYNSFGNSCSSNSFGNECYFNSFGNCCCGNSLGTECNDNSFGNSCFNNSFVNDCYSSSFGTECNDNSFGNSCYNNSFGNNCHDNSFGNNCFNNSFGNGCNNITFSKAYTFYSIVENGNRYITLTSTQTTSSSNLLRNITIAQGVNNTTTTKNISHNTVNDIIKTTYKPTGSVDVSV